MTSKAVFQGASIELLRKAKHQLEAHGHHAVLVEDWRLSDVGARLIVTFDPAFEDQVHDIVAGVDPTAKPVE